jgi:transcriptional regulator with XRE-family HTH domain
MKKRDKQEQPFASLGNTLKSLRTKRQESLAEVSGAVEIDVDALSNFEQGNERPSEDILLLLISYFSVKEDVATKLWELAGYDQEELPNANMVNGDGGDVQQSVMVMPADARVAYTDMVHVMVNNYGVVMNFMQGSGPNNQPLAVARVGMSKEHARSVLEVLQQTLAQNESLNNQKPKSLPEPKKKTDHRETN